jgi:ADP-ribose pyrophosphatase YjhB (NUDIX family)
MIPGIRSRSILFSSERIDSSYMVQVVLVKGWKSSSGWGFPKGKINQNEPSHECAAREVRPIHAVLDPYYNVFSRLQKKRVTASME